MKHTSFVFTSFAILGFALTTTAQIGTLPKIRTTRTIIVGTPEKMPSIQDTLSMLMNKINSLQNKVDALKKNSLPGGKKTLVTIVPDANNFCFPYQDSLFPNNEYYQGVIIDNAICNNNPEAVIIVTVKTKRAGIVPHAVLYDVADGKWKISVQGYFIGSLAKNVQCWNSGG